MKVYYILVANKMKEYLIFLNVLQPGLVWYPCWMLLFLPQTGWRDRPQHVATGPTGE